MFGVTTRAEPRFYVCLKFCFGVAVVVAAAAGVGAGTGAGLGAGLGVGPGAEDKSRLAKGAAEPSAYTEPSTA